LQPPGSRERLPSMRVIFLVQGPLGRRFLRGKAGRFAYVRCSCGYTAFRDGNQRGQRLEPALTAKWRFYMFAEAGELTLLDTLPQQISRFELASYGFAPGSGCRTISMAH
jgi:hypothetical protein